MAIRKTTAERIEDTKKRLEHYERKMKTLLQERKQKAERRINTLKEHIKQGDNLKKYHGYKTRHDNLYEEYQASLKSKGFGTKRKAEKPLSRQTKTTIISARRYPCARSHRGILQT